MLFYSLGLCYNDLFDFSLLDSSKMLLLRIIPYFAQAFSLSFHHVSILMIFGHKIIFAFSDVFPA